ncbi:MAG TPA: acyltransferase [Stellaceae bacterium]|nr:acyltransferase [Stellaceae bacterium]
MSPRGVSRTFLGIQYLRALAAGLVVVWHAYLYIATGVDPAHETASLGQAGVDIFFVISGFIIFYTTGVAAMTSREFMARRIVRIVPTYWLYTTVAIATFLVAPGVFRHFALAPWHTIASYLFIPAYHPRSTGLIFPTLVLGWTLNYEMFFYAVFACLLTMSLAARLGAVLAIMLGLAVLGVVVEPDAAVLKFYTDPLVLEFVGGCAVAWMVIRGVRVPRGLCLGLVVLAVLGLAASPAAEEWPRCIRWGAPSLMLVAAAALYEAGYGIGRVGLLERLGDASYSIYLTHTFTIPAGALLWQRAGLSEYPHTLFAIPAAVASLSVGWLAYAMIERRATSFFRALLAMSRESRVPT